MKKKKSKINREKFFSIIIFLGVILIIFLTLRLMVLNEKVEYKIYENKCWNKTFIMGYFEYPEWNGSLSKFSDINDIEINFNLSSSCPSCAIPIISPTREVEYMRIDKIQNIRKYKDMVVGDVEKCEENEVNEILVKKWDCSVWQDELYNIEKPFIENCQEEIILDNGLNIPSCYLENTLEIYKFNSRVNKILSEFYECRYLALIQNYIIKKEDLNESWLKENAEMERCTVCEDLSCKNQKCDLYYIGDYIIEVER